MAVWPWASGATIARVASTSVRLTTIEFGNRDIVSVRLTTTSLDGYFIGLLAGPPTSRRPLGAGAKGCSVALLAVMAALHGVGGAFGAAHAGQDGLDAGTRDLAVRGIVELHADAGRAVALGA